VSKYINKRKTPQCLSCRENRQRGCTESERRAVQDIVM